MADDVVSRHEPDPLLVCGDVMADYAGLVARLGGEPVQVGVGVGRLDPLDPASFGAADRAGPGGEVPG